MESQIRGKFAQIGRTDTCIKAKIDQKSHQGANDFTQTLLKYIGFSAIIIVLYYYNYNNYCRKANEFKKSLGNIIAPW